jgi:hypothetical protein
MSSNVLRLPVIARPRPSISNPLAALADLSARVAEIGQMRFESSEDMQEAVFLLGLLNARARQLIRQIDGEESRTRLLTHSERIRELIEIASRKAADL